MLERSDIDDLKQLDEKILMPQFLKQTSALHIAAYLINSATIENDKILFISAATVTEQLHTFFEKQRMDKLNTMKAL